MSRARIVCSEILSRMSPIHHFDDKVYTNLNASQDKVFNLCFNECSNSENTDVSSVLSEINTSMDDWLRQKTTYTSLDCIDNAYLNDINFLSTRDPDMCSSDVGLELILVNNEKKEPNLNYCTMNDKNSDLDYTDPLLNLVPMNEVLLRKTETKCDNLISGKDLYPSDGETSLNKASKSVWDTLSIASRKSDCDAENNSDFADFNLLPLSFDTNDHINSLEPLTEHNVQVKNQSTVKNTTLVPTQNKSDSNEASSSSSSSSSSSGYPVVNNTVTVTTMKASNNEQQQQQSTTTSPNSRNKKLITVKRPNILRATNHKASTTNDMLSKVTDKNMNVDLLNSLNNSVFNFTNDDFASTPDPELLTLLPEELDGSMNLTISNETKALKLNQSEEEKKVRRKHKISEINNMPGSVAIVSNSVGKTRIAIKTAQGVERYEGNTAELTEAVGLGRSRSRRPDTPVEGEHIVINVNTAQQRQCEREPEDRVVRDMLTVLGITDDMLYTIATNLGMRMWVCPEHECRRIFNRLNTLKSHILSHYGLKPFKCDFPNCPWSFYTSFKLKRHRETHLKRKDFTCTVPDCKRTFTTVYNLNTHLKLHERPARLKCLVRSCAARFQTRRAMEMHLKTHELALAPYKCMAAGCSKLYFSLGALTAHMRCHQHKEEELRCQWENCGRRFDKPCRLKAHMRIHTGDKPYVCRFQDCHWAFASSSKLKRHQYKHNNERRFRCTIGDCTKAFMRSEHLREHTFTHIAQRTFQCAICGEKCSAKATLYVHKKKFHSNEIKPKKTETKTNENAAFLLALLPDDSDKTEQIPLVTSRPVVQDVDGKEYGVNLDNPPSTSTGSKSRKLRKPKAKTNKSCARTYLPYVDKTVVDTETDLATDTSSSAVTAAAAATIMLDNNVAVEEDVLLSSFPAQNNASVTASTTTNHQTVYLSNLMLQDATDTTDAVTEDLYTHEDGTEYILLFDSGTDTAFPESTVNLKDLD